MLSFHYQCVAGRVVVARIFRGGLFYKGRGIDQSLGKRAPTEQSLGKRAPTDQSLDKRAPTDQSLDKRAPTVKLYGKGGKNRFAQEVIANPSVVVRTELMTCRETVRYRSNL